MLDTIVYIPTILAYAFISLLVIILCFIVVYISHRIYVCLYDNLPVAHAALSTIMSVDSKDNAPNRAHSSILLRSTSGINERKTKTALRIIVTLAPTYLAYVALELEKCGKKSNMNKEQYKLIKYYDRLSQIPMINPLSRCTSEHELYASSGRKMKQRPPQMSRNTIDCESNVLNKSANASTKSVATSTTKLTSFNVESFNVKQEPSVIRPSGSVIRPSSSVVRPSVTFANAVNALANIKLATPAEDSQ
ncbi:PREDICTED: uncharacterized protein LOC108380474 [Rhagoletis zephyria]|uniref:uncharacterized protein LOC108380474 n=1 Tax=Rhagoletis zephyria TaxID=28612 RepID=UPI00081145CF|nr:PREDICTED: uncharacterized protein LOC108380474 [Rhagoletis zephyria]